MTPRRRSILLRQKNTYSNADTSQRLTWLISTFLSTYFIQKEKLEIIHFLYQMYAEYSSQSRTFKS